MSLEHETQLEGLLSAHRMMGEARGLSEAAMLALRIDAVVLATKLMNLADERMVNAGATVEKFKK